MAPTFDANAIPTTDELVNAASLEIWDVEGKKVKFGSLFEDSKVVVVFIRHFFCGVCQAYVENLSRVPSEAVEAAGTRIIVIGCGEWEAIKTYHETTNFKGAIYADPSRALYHALGMTLGNLQGTPAGQDRPSYLAHTSKFMNAVQSTWRALKNGNLIGKQGNLKQLGGDFVLGPNNHCTFASRMENTEDHVPVAELMKAAGVDYQES